MGLKIGIVEDDVDKLLQVRGLIEELLTGAGDDVVAMQCIKDAKEQLAKESFDVLILDLNVPLGRGGIPIPSSGVKLLKQVCESARYFRPRHVLFLSAFKKEMDGLGGNEVGRSWQAIGYSKSDDSWREELLHKLEYIASSEQQRREKGFDYDCVFVTALERPELEALERTDPAWTRLNGAISGIELKFTDGSGRHFKFAAASAMQMGCTAAAVLAHQMVEAFRPKLLIMCGISAGVKRRTNIGDVLGADPCWEWGSGKYVQVGKKTRFLHAPNQLRASPELIRRLKNKVLVRKILRSVEDSWNGDEPKSNPQLRVGPVVSGAAVVASATVTKQIQAQHRNILGIEMEAYGVYFSNEHATVDRAKCISLKAVCDFADSKKSDAHQNYAAHVSARFAFEFAREIVAEI